MSCENPKQSLEKAKTSSPEEARLQALLIFEQLGLPSPSAQYEGDTMGFIFDSEDGDIRVEIMFFENGDIGVFGNCYPPSIAGDILIEKVMDEFAALWRARNSNDERLE